MWLTGFNVLRKIQFDGENYRTNYSGCIFVSSSAADSLVPTTKSLNGYFRKPTIYKIKKRKTEIKNLFLPFLYPEPDCFANFY